MKTNALFLAAFAAYSHALQVEPKSYEWMHAIPDDDANPTLKNDDLLTSLAAGDTGSAAHTCTLSIERSQAGPYDWNAIM
jgi:hypothetical protein